MRKRVAPGSKALIAVSSAAFVVALCACGGLGNKTSQTAVPLPNTAPKSGEEDGAKAPPTKAPVENQDRDYIDASKRAAQQGEVRVSVVEVQVGKVKLVDFGGTGESKDDLLQIGLLVENLSKTKIVRFNRWQRGGFDRVVELRDDFGNSYTNRVSGLFSSRVVEKEKEVGISNDLYPEKQVDDLLVFNPPVQGISYFLLTLEAKNFEGDGTLKFHIPLSMIGQREREREKQRQAAEQEKERQRELEQERQRQAEAQEKERLRIAREKEELEAEERREREAQRAKDKVDEDARKAKAALHAEKRYGGYDAANAKALAFRNEALKKRNMKYKDVDDNGGITSERLNKNAKGKEFWVFEGQITIEVDGKELTSTWIVSPQFVPSAGETGLWRCNDVTISDPK